jgi:hypothetical protein
MAAGDAILAVNHVTETSIRALNADYDWDTIFIEEDGDAVTPYPALLIAARRGEQGELFNSVLAVSNYADRG